MNRLTAPRIALTLVALVGLLPVTLLFLYGIVAVFIPKITADHSRAAATRPSQP